MKKSSSIELFSSLMLLCLMLINYSGTAQENNLNAFRSRLLDSDLNAIAGASIKNLSNQALTTSDSSGFFSIKATQNDSLLISALGFELRKVFVSSIPLPFIHLKQIVFSLEQVTVYEFKNWDAFKKEFIEAEIKGERVNITGLPAGKPSQKPIPLRSNTWNSKPGVLHFIHSPFSSLAYYTNKKEKSKRKVWRLMIQENNQSAYWASMHADSIKTWTSIPDSLLNDFILFCNKEIEDKEVWTSYFYKERIIELYPLYLKQIGRP